MEFSNRKARGRAQQSRKQGLLSRGLKIFAVIIGVLVFARPASAEGDQGRVITIVVDNYAKASSTILVQAEREASRIFGETGLQIVWVNCFEKHAGAEPDGRCQGEPAIDILALRVLSQPTSGELHKLQDSVFGFAVHPILASVYYEGAAGLAQRDDAGFELPVVLGCVIVHELGHLLLGSNSHSGSGIMQAHWGRDEVRKAMMGRMLFTSEQSTRIREELQTRMKQAGWGQTNAISTPASVEKTASDLAGNTLAVIGGTADQEALLRSQIQTMHPEILPLRIVFVPHWKYVDTARTFHLHVPTGYTSALFTHLPSRSVFIDSDRCPEGDWLGYWMAHELGHLKTNSASENDAEKGAREYRTRLEDAHKHVSQKTIAAKN